MDKTLENTLKAEINTKLPTCDDRGVFTDDDVFTDDETQVVYSGKKVGRYGGGYCDMDLASVFQVSLVCSLWICE